MFIYYLGISLSYYELISLLIGRSGYVFLICVYKNLNIVLYFENMFTAIVEYYFILLHVTLNVSRSLKSRVFFSKLYVFSVVYGFTSHRE